MKYYRYLDEWGPLEGGYTYLEVQNDHATRQVTVKGRQYLASNVLDPQFGLGLAEGKLLLEGEEGVQQIGQSEFQRVWQGNLDRNSVAWERAKQLHGVGQNVRGWIEIFYPQGVIVNLGDATLGLADYAECRASTRAEFMYTRHVVSAVIAGYDEEQQWILLRVPRVHEERVPL